MAASASADGVSFFSASLAATKASMGLRVARDSDCGTGGLVSGWSDQSAALLLPAGGASGHRAPCSIQVRISATCAGESGASPIGILGLSPEIMRSSRLSSGLPGTMAGPCRPPFLCIGGGGQREAAHSGRCVMTFETALRQDDDGLGRFGRARDRSHGEGGENHMSGRGQHHQTESIVQPTRVAGAKPGTDSEFPANGAENSCQSPVCGTPSFRRMVIMGHQLVNAD